MTELHESLLECLSDLAMIATTLETIDLFPKGDPVRAEMQTIIDDANSNLKARLEAICLRIEGAAEPTGITRSSVRTHC